MTVRSEGFTLGSCWLVQDCDMKLVLSCTAAYCVGLLVGGCKVKNRQQAVLVDTVSAWRLSGHCVWKARKGVGGGSVLLVC
jgi:hypothetical protein